MKVLLENSVLAVVEFSVAAVRRRGTRCRDTYVIQPTPSTPLADSRRRFPFQCTQRITGFVDDDT